MSKAELEEKIMSSANDLLVILGMSGDSPEFSEKQPLLDAFINAWLDLVDYYRKHNDDQISISLVEVHRFWISNLSRILSRSRSLALQDVFDDLIGCMDSICEYNNERKDLPDWRI